MNVARPSVISVSVSNDGKKFKKVKELSFTKDEMFADKVSVNDIDFGTLKAKGRYVKIDFKNPGVCPEGNTRAGQKTWIQFDEIIIN